MAVYECRPHFWPCIMECLWNCKRIRTLRTCTEVLGCLSQSCWKVWRSQGGWGCQNSVKCSETVRWQLYDVSKIESNASDIALLPNFNHFIIPRKWDVEKKVIQIKVFSVIVRGLMQASVRRQDNKNVCIPLIHICSVTFSLTQPLTISLPHYLPSLSLTHLRVVLR